MHCLRETGHVAFVADETPVVDDRLVVIGLVEVARELRAYLLNVVVVAARRRIFVEQRPDATVRVRVQMLAAPQQLCAICLVVSVEGGGGGVVLSERVSDTLEFRLGGDEYGGIHASAT